MSTDKRLLVDSQSLPDYAIRIRAKTSATLQDALYIVVPLAFLFPSAGLSSINHGRNQISIRVETFRKA